MQRKKLSEVVFASWEAVIARFRQLLWLACAAVLLPPCGRTQSPAQAEASPSEGTVRGWLYSGEPRLVAWGAHDVLVSHNPYLVTDLLTLASQWQPLEPQTPGGSRGLTLSAEQKDQRAAMAAVVDALIQLNVTVPAETVRNLAPDFGNAAAVLLSRMPIYDAAPLAFDLYRTTTQSYALQYVSAALLALHPVPGFAADLLAKTDVRATIFVILPGSDGFAQGSSGSCGPSSNVAHPGWPTIIEYILSSGKTEGALMLVTGVNPVYAARRETTYYEGPACGGIALGPNERVWLIQEMLGGSSGKVPWQTSLLTNIEFESKEQFRTALLAFVEEQQSMYRATGYALAWRGLMEDSQVLASLPVLHLSLSDMRGPGTEAIVKDEIALPPRVEWSNWP